MADDEEEKMEEAIVPGSLDDEGDKPLQDDAKSESGLEASSLEEESREKALPSSPGQLHTSRSEDGDGPIDIEKGDDGQGQTISDETDTSEASDGPHSHTAPPEEREHARGEVPVEQRFSLGRCSKCDRRARLKLLDCFHLVCEDCVGECLNAANTVLCPHQGCLEETSLVGRSCAGGLFGIPLPTFRVRAPPSTVSGGDVGEEATSSGHHGHRQAAVEDEEEQAGSVR